MGNTISFISRLNKFNDELQSLPSMKECFEKHLPTKNGHNYLPLYDRHFCNIRHEKLKVLEIGVEAGTSLRLWADYFPNAEIYGLDIDPACKVHEGERINIHIGDQMSVEALSSLPKDFDVIIDDGIHTIKSQIFCFEHLFKHNMKQRGIYVVEDIIGRNPVFDYFNEMALKVNWWPKGEPGGIWSSLDDFDEYLKKERTSPEEVYWIKNIIGIATYRHIVFIDKGLNPQDGQANLRVDFPETVKAMSNVRGDFLDNSGFVLNKYNSRS